jgi:Fic family protein
MVWPKIAPYAILVYVKHLNTVLAKRLDQKLDIINKHRPIPSTIVSKLKEQFAIEMTYNSNAIEGNRLTLKETYLVISEGLTVKGKSLKDHLEAKDHYEAIHFLFELIEHDQRHTVSEHMIRSLQQMVVRETDAKNAGSYRTGNVMITGSSHTHPEAHEVPHFMKQFVDWLRYNVKNYHPVELAALAHHRLVHIHPFVDGNGRTARLFMNLLLMQQGYPLVTILKNDRKKYYDVLDKADRGKCSALVQFIAQAVERSLNLYLKILCPSNSRKERDAKRYVSLSEIAKNTSFSAKYLNLLIRTGKLEGHKEGRNWVSSKEALESYLAGKQRKRKLT